MQSAVSYHPLILVIPHCCIYRYFDEELKPDSVLDTVLSTIMLKKMDTENALTAWTYRHWSGCL